MPVTGYFTRIPGDLADTRYLSWALEHAYRVVTDRQVALWHPAHYYPFQGTLGFSENCLGSAAVYIVARLAGLPREYAYDVWFVVGTLLNFASAFYVLR